MNTWDQGRKHWTVGLGECLRPVCVCGKDILNSLVGPGKEAFGDSVHGHTTHKDFHKKKN